MFINDILKVLYAPHKAFKEIVKNPSYLGPLLILIVFVAAQVGFYYVRASKIYSEQTMPTGLLADQWTENATLWQASSGVVITNNYLDFINATPAFAGGYDYYGNSSIQFVLNNGTNLQMALADLDGSVNCGADGFKDLTMRVKIASPEAEPQNVTLYLYSLNDANYFSYDLTQLFSNSKTDVWNNITVPVGSGAWSASNAAAKWENITSLRMFFGWSAESNIQIRVDGLYFRGIYENAIKIYGDQALLFNYALNSVTPFIFEWLVMTGLMYLITKGLRGTVFWKPLMVSVGLAFVTFIVQSLLLLATYSTLSAINVPVEYFAGVPGEFDAANQAILSALDQVSFVGGIVTIAVYIWTIGLGTFIIRAATGASAATATGAVTPATGEVVVGMQPSQFGWLKCIVISAASFLLTILILGFVFGV